MKFQPFKFAGIGSRKIPATVYNLIKECSYELALKSCKLTTGAADGSDEAWEEGFIKAQCTKNMQCFLPWKGFSKRDCNKEGYVLIQDKLLLTNAEIIARQFHPNWNALTEPGQKLMTRNTFQVLGEDLRSPVHSLFCYTPDGKDSGGTGQAIRIARSRQIPVLNLYNKEELDVFMKIVAM